MKAKVGLIVGTNFVGVVDFGLGESSEQPATHALVFMVVALNGSFKIPIAHFFTTGINAKGRYDPLTQDTISRSHL